MSSLKKAMQETESAHVVYEKYLRANLPKDTVLAKQYVWAADKKQAFVRVELVSEEGDTVTVTEGAGATSTYKKSDIYEYNPPRFDGVEDLGDLSYLNEASVLHNLRLRHTDKRIHTYSGLFLVIINPYQRFPIYSPSVIEMYKGKRRNEIAPHCFTVADQAFRNMVDERQNQSILITGESGAGKTENTKKVILYLTNVAVGGGKALKTKQGGLEDQILQANPLLEAFGNAKTLRNDNSSRFGKFIQLQFSSRFSVVGASIHHYLLELSRVVWQSQGERNYHIFYQIFSLPAEHKAKLRLTKMEDYHYTNQSGCYTVDSFVDKEEWDATKEAMDVMGITAEDQESVLLVVAAILHVGNTTFKGGEKAATVANPEVLAIPSELMGVDSDGLATAMTKQKIFAAGQKIVKERNQESAQFARDALVKIVYDKLFSWIVHRINQTIDHSDAMKYFIGVLDIAGFEIFELNSLEQLLINYTNERLQQFFNSHMFKLEQDEYAREKIVWQHIDFGMDLQPTIEMLERKGGVLDTLDEQCVFPKATDKSYIEKLHDHFAKADSLHPKYIKPRIGHEEKFSVRHYAGDVEYNVTAWLTKNMNPLTDDITELLEEAGHPFIKHLFEGMTHMSERKGTAKKKVITVASQHREQLNKLMHTLSATHPHFIRCIKPNPNKSPDEYVNLEVLEQLRCNGVMEGIRIAAIGFPNRMPFGEFRKRFGLLCKDPSQLPLDIRDACGKIIEDLDFTDPFYMLREEDTKMAPDWYQLGRTKAFFRAGKLALLEQMRDRVLSLSAVRLQGVARGFLARNADKRKAREDAAAECLQKNVRIHIGDITNLWLQLFRRLRPLVKPNRLKEEEEERKVELEKLRKELAELRDVRGSLSSKIAALEAELKDAQGRLGDNEQQIDMLKRAIAQAKHDLDENLRYDRETEDAVGMLQRNLDEQQAALTKKEKDAYESDEKAQALFREKQDINARLDMEMRAREEAEASNAKLQDSITHATERAEEEGRSRANLEKSKSSLNGDQKTLADQMESTKSARKRVEAELASVRTECDDLRAELDEVDRLRRKFESDINQINSKLRVKEDEKNSRASAVGGLKDSLAQEEQRKDQLEEDSKRDLARARAQAQEELDQETQDAAEAAKKAKKNFQKKYEDLQSEHEAAELKNQSLREEKATLEAKHKKAVEDQAAAAAAAAASEQLEEVKKRKVELQVALDDHEAARKRLERELKQLTSDKEDLLEDKKDLDVKYEKKQKKVEANLQRFTEKFTAEEAAHNKLKADQEKMVADMAALEQSLRDSKTKREQGEAERRRMEAELNDVLEEQKYMRANQGSLIKESLREKHRDLMDAHELLEDMRAARYEAEDNVLEEKNIAAEASVDLGTHNRDIFVAESSIKNLEEEVEKWKKKLAEARERWATELDETRRSHDTEIANTDKTCEAAIISSWKAEFTNRSINRQLTTSQQRLRFAGGAGGPPRRSRPVEDTASA